jgi:hypothetical protein
MDLFSALLNIDQKKIEAIISQLSDVVNMKDEGNEPFIGRAKRLYEVKRPLLEKYFQSESEWQQFVVYIQKG